MRFVWVLALLLVVPAASAAEWDQGIRLWNEQFDSLGLLEIGPAPEIPRLDATGLVMWFHDSINLENLTFQACEVGNACWEVDIEPEDLGQDGDRGHKYVFSTRQLTNPPPLEPGMRVGFQLFWTSNETGNLTYHHFPEGIEFGGEDCDEAEEFLACSESHYLAQTIPLDAEQNRDTPFPVLAPLGALLLARRFRS